MHGKHLTKQDDGQEVDESNTMSWLSWCRLCAKRELNDQESTSIFLNGDAGSQATELATSVGKYFWVNIKADDEVSQCLCWECKQLVEKLVTFTERVNKVQTLFCLLQNIKPTTAEQANKFRSQCGLKDEEWQHIIKPELPKTLLIDQQIQTDFTFITSIQDNQPKNLELYKDTEEIDNILGKADKEAGEYESQSETEAEQVYAYVMQDENGMEFIGNVEYEERSVRVNHSDIKETSENINEAERKVDEDEVQDSDLFKELKYKLEDEAEEEVNVEEQRQSKYITIISSEEEIEVEYHDSSQHEEEKVEQESVEMLGEEDGEDDDEDYVSTNDTKSNKYDILKTKRGRPFGSSKKTNSDDSCYRFECKDCKRKYKNPNIYRKHMITVHDVIVDLPDYQQPNNSCNVCGKEFITQSSLRLHMRHHLPDEEKYNIPCPYCDRKFSQVGAMRQHVKGIHHQMKPFICDQCGRACKTMAALSEHQLVHTNECPFECEVCHKKFKNKPRLKSHLDTHTQKFYTCPDCGLELNTKRTLLQHRLVHSDVKRFKCEFCDAAFKRSKALKNHLILHSGLRPYKCNFCSKLFANGSNCRAHKKRSHPVELAEEEANGKVPERLSIPRLEELKSAKSALVQPRKIKRNGSLPDHLVNLLDSSEKRKRKNSQDYEYAVAAAENSETYSDYQYEIGKSEIDETESLVDNPSEECEETVIYEIIDEI